MDKLNGNNRCVSLDIVPNNLTVIVSQSDCAVGQKSTSSIAATLDEESHYIGFQRATQVR